MRPFALLAAPALLAGCATTPAQSEAPAWTSVSFTMNSWGQPLTSWTVQADGSGTWSVSEPKDGDYFNRQTITVSLPADAAAATALAERIAALPATPPTGDGCRERITDQVYGALFIAGSGGTTKDYAYNAGCLDAPYAQFIATIRDVNGLVLARGEAARD
ncbi:hypothetical protein [Alteraurantiacibacter buctensis]|uniref:Lipoprotein n=1 Tax=Alteraurantiacibacter buctensis TaxID=1503981 RepID=A0A844Z2J9_9SPHN|nr:hypothetical protein [Alteraurantiacibacter buctensis]MXO73446.1 hypothetical protein [Alteraurantiacibacter buctensis]